VADKSPRGSQSKKPAKSLKEKRVAKNEKKREHKGLGEH